MVSIVSPSICREVMGPDAMILVFDLFFSQPHFRYCEKEAQRLELLVHGHAVGAGSLHSLSEVPLLLPQSTSTGPEGMLTFMQEEREFALRPHISQNDRH